MSESLRISIPCFLSSWWDRVRQSGVDQLLRSCWKRQLVVVFGVAIVMEKQIGMSVKYRFWNDQRIPPFPAIVMVLILSILSRGEIPNRWGVEWLENTMRINKLLTLTYQYIMLSWLQLILTFLITRLRTHVDNFKSKTSIMWN